MNAQLEPIVSTQTSGLHSRLIRERAFNHPLHYHPEIEITYIAHSRGTRLIGDHIGTFNEGDLCLIGRDLPHLYTNKQTGATPGAFAEAEVLQFRRDFSGGLIDASPEMSSFAQLLDRAELGLTFDPNTAIKCGKLMRAIRLQSGFARLRLFMDLVDCLLRADSVTPLASPGYCENHSARNCERMQAAYSHIMEHFSEHIDHHTLAQKAHLAPASFCRRFKRLTRKTCTQFINEVRLGHACRLLMETDQSITEIAFSCGFRNLSNFNRRFRERYACSPRDYRTVPSR